MGLLSLLQRPTGESGRATVDSGSVEDLRQRARRRLIGAAVLVVIGVVGFPLLFDSTPRPVAVDVPIEIPGKDRVAPLVPPKPSVASGTVMSPKSPPAVAESAAEAPREPAASTALPAEPRTATAAALPPSQKPTDALAKPLDTPVDKPAVKPQAAAVEEARAQAALDARPSPAPAAGIAKAPSADARFVVQVGAFSDAALARDARARVEKLGLSSYTQVVETAAGPRTRVRVGPFSDRSEADRAAVQIKQSGLPAAVLTL
jgi:DedD protein